MKTKVIIDTSAALTHLNSMPENAAKMNQKELADNSGISEQNLISWKTKAPKVAAAILKIQQVTGAPLDVIIKEVPL